MDTTMGRPDPDPEIHSLAQAVSAIHVSGTDASVAATDDLCHVMTKEGYEVTHASGLVPLDGPEEAIAKARFASYRSAPPGCAEKYIARQAIEVIATICPAWRLAEGSLIYTFRDLQHAL